MTLAHLEFTECVKKWNNKVYGHIISRKRHLTRKLNNIQYALDKKESTYLSQVEIEVREELESVLHHEEILWC